MYYSLSISLHSCRVIQKLISNVKVEQRIEIYNELEPYLLNCIENANGNHVVQLCLQTVPNEYFDSILALFIKDTVHLANHCYGCRVFQLLLINCKNRIQTDEIIHTLYERITEVSMNQVYLYL